MGQGQVAHMEQWDMGVHPSHTSSHTAHVHHACRALPEGSRLLWDLTPMGIFPFHQGMNRPFLLSCTAALLAVQHPPPARQAPVLWQLSQQQDANPKEK